MDAFKSIINRIGDFFDIFDLSFFISGATSAGALFVWMMMSGNSQVKVFTSGFNIFIVILGCYVIGLINFACGRFLRTSISSIVGKIKNKGSYSRLKSILVSHHLDTHAHYKEYFNEENKDLSSRNMMSLYIRLWADVRQDQALLPSFSLLRRYWVLAATFDGLAFSLILWIISLVLWMFQVYIAIPLDPWLGWPITGVLIFITIICSREACRYNEYQMEELCATIAHKMKSRNDESRTGEQV
jgi:hypothetical protein